MFDLKSGVDSKEFRGMLHQIVEERHRIRAPIFCFHRTFSALTSIRHVASYLILLKDRSESLSQELRVAPSLGKHLVYFRVVGIFPAIFRIHLFFGSCDTII